MKYVYTLRNCPIKLQKRLFLIQFIKFYFLKKLSVLLLKRRSLFKLPNYTLIDTSYRLSIKPSDKWSKKSLNFE